MLDDFCWICRYAPCVHQPQVSIQQLSIIKHWSPVLGAVFLDGSILLLFSYLFVIHIAMHLLLSSTGRLSRLSTGRSESKSSYSRNSQVPSSASSVSSRSIRSISPQGKPWKWFMYNLNNLQSFPFNPWSICIVELFLFMLQQYC